MLTMTELSSLAAAPSSTRTTLVGLVSAFNRCETTLRAMKSFEAQVVDDDVLAAMVLMDDGSTDGTAEAVAAAFPTISILRGDGGAFWSRGMAEAQAFALSAARPDYLLWLNDDVVLAPDAIGLLLSTARLSHDEAVVVGALRDPASDSLAYSGYLRVGPRPRQLKLAEPNGRPQPVDTFNGNVVLVPRVVYLAVGAIDGSYAHAYGDVDYGYRVASAGFGSILSPQAVGKCSRNAVRGTWRDPRLNPLRRIALLVSRKGEPPLSYARFQRRHGGRRWLVNVVGTYVGAVVEILATQRWGSKRAAR